MLIGITGATGSIGLELGTLLLNKGHHVRALSRTQLSSQTMDWCEFDLTDSVEVMASKLRDVDVVVHLAAKVPQKNNLDDGKEYWEINVLGMQRLVKAMESAGVGRLVLAAAANAYNPDTEEAWESSAFYPRSRILYLASKVAQEWYASALCEELLIDCTILRISSIIGDGKSVIDKLAQQLANGDSVSIGSNSRFGADFVSREDVCKGIVLAIEKELVGIFNLSSGNRALLLDCVLEIADMLNCGREKVHLERSVGPADPGFPSINCDRLRDHGYSPTPIRDTLKNICVEAIEHFDH